MPKEQRSCFLGHGRTLSRRTAKESIIFSFDVESGADLPGKMEDRARLAGKSGRPTAAPWETSRVHVIHSGKGGRGAEGCRSMIPRRREEPSFKIKGFGYEMGSFLG